MTYIVILMVVAELAATSYHFVILLLVCFFNLHIYYWLSSYLSIMAFLSFAHVFWELMASSTNHSFRQCLLFDLLAVTPDLPNDLFLSFVTFLCFACDQKEGELARICLIIFGFLWYRRNFVLDPLNQILVCSFSFGPYCWSNLSYIIDYMGLFVVSCLIDFLSKTKHPCSKPAVFAVNFIFK